eukprot:m.301667 g.301667  ORF g.301667 m.301667 type:complete len:438 (-) comp14883_c0_seq1:89-1402(-)
MAPRSTLGPVFAILGACGFALVFLVPWLHAPTPAAPRGATIPVGTWLGRAKSVNIEQSATKQPLYDNRQSHSDENSAEGSRTGTALQAATRREETKVSGQMSGGNGCAPHECGEHDLLCLAKHAAGIYCDPARGGPLASKTVLVVVSNIGYYVALKNWICRAREFGLKYLVYSLDDPLYEALQADGERYVYRDLTNNVRTNAFAFRSPQFNLISARKLAIVRELLSMNFHVWLSDADIFFLSDPWPHFADDRCDYQYQQENNPPQELDEPVDPGAEGNTGFHLFRPSKLMGQLLEQAIDRCIKEPELDDQRNFWNVLREWYTSYLAEPLAFREGLHFNHSRRATVPKPEVSLGSKALQLCPLNQVSHTIHRVRFDMKASNWIAYAKSHNIPPVIMHANWIRTYKRKLETMQREGYWVLDEPHANASCIPWPAQSLMP